jgi:putative hydrolase of the HAD superfamily
MDASKLTDYFTSVVTSDGAGYKKPDAAIFHFALDKANARKHESVMIGDNLQTDIIGAKNFGIDHIYFNPEKRTHKATVTHEIDCLSQLKEIL